MNILNKLLILSVALFLLSACSSKRITVNGLICPSEYSEHKIEKDLSQCQYYDEKKAAEASKSTITPECRSCLEDKGYELE